MNDLNERWSTMEVAVHLDHAPADELVRVGDETAACPRCGSREGFNEVHRCFVCGYKTKEQRTRDAKRDRWFAARKVRTLRWTASEITRNPQECVRELLEIVRGRQARA